jgi:dihydroorotase-like cyclic amidohydrolase
MSSWIIRSERVVLPDGMRPAEIHVADGRITNVSPLGTPGTLGTLGTLFFYGR